jgi:hypothetical protein
MKRRGRTDADPAARTERPPRRPDEIDGAERAAFLHRARPLTPLVAGEIDGSTFLIRTGENSEEPLFTRRSHPRLAALEAAMHAVDELGLAPTGSSMFLDRRAGTGIATVAALRRHGFTHALACEPDPAAYDVLRLNVAVNDLRDRVRVLPLAPADATLDELAERGILGGPPLGLVWTEEPTGLEELQGGRQTLAALPPLLLRVSAGDADAAAALLATVGYMHFTAIGDDTAVAMKPLSELAVASGGGRVLALGRRVGTTRPVDR